MFADALSWISIPLDPVRPHDVSDAVAWHGRLMVLAWSVLLPVGVLVARFCKITPGQPWPRVLDTKVWWYGHLGLQYTGCALMLAGLGIQLLDHAPRGGSYSHGLLGYGVIALGFVQIFSGLLRGSKGGPGEPALRGDHYDMTARRILFEYLHKSLGYIALLLAILAIATGLWLANAPRWMALAVGGWWSVLAVLFILLQRRGQAFDTYQAIWGPDDSHPGNRRKAIGWGVRLPSEKETLSP